MSQTNPTHSLCRTNSNRVSPRRKVRPAYTPLGLTHPLLQDDCSVVESPFAPEVTTAPPDFGDYVPAVAPVVDEHLDPSGEPEWIHDFDPWIGNSMARYRAMVDATGLHGDQLYFGGF